MLNRLDNIKYCHDNKIFIVINVFVAKQIHVMNFIQILKHNNIKNTCIKVLKSIFSSSDNTTAVYDLTYRNFLDVRISGYQNLQGPCPTNVQKDTI